ncbi:hypothetical protein [Latilactobacillus fragifolii]|uniref:hypothetical protein n=1 Tax=Latilactobacillus fragifolii TaxID=2814244 RepID=UPI001ABAA180|nr:hypothetical protein [Latilactobacillus fragifolii]
MINLITQSQASYLLENYQNQTVGDILYGKYIVQANGRFIAIDNINGQAFTEDFQTLSQAVNWLNERFEIDDYLSGKINENGEFY